MEHDIRRGRGQWRGVHVFDDIICEGDQVNHIKRKGGLKQGEKYYYYYEVDGSAEVHDPTKPTTNKCPFLPGQTVNTLEVPSERSLASRSVSLNSLRDSEYKTLKPEDRFTTPRPAPSVPQAPMASEQHRVASAPSKELRHKGSAPCTLRNFHIPHPHHHHHREKSSERDAKEHHHHHPFSSRKRSMSTRRLLGGLNPPKPSSRGSDSARTVAGHEHETIVPRSSSLDVQRGRDRDTIRSTASSGSLRTRDLSPETLRRYLMDGLPDEKPTHENLPKVLIPDDDADAAEDADDDDDNFASSAVSENMPFTTLSPPPSQRSVVAPSFMGSKNSSTLTVVPASAPTSAPTSAGRDKFKRELRLNIQEAHTTTSEASTSTMNSPVSMTTAPSLASRDLSNHSFFDDSDDDEVASPYEEASFPYPNSSKKAIKGEQAKGTPFAGYSLPQPDPDSEKKIRTGAHPDLTAVNSVRSVTPAENDTVPIGGPTNLLSLPRIEIGLGDLSSEFGWVDGTSVPRAL